MIPDEKEAVLEFLPSFQTGTQPVFRASHNPWPGPRQFLVASTYTYFRIQQDLAVRQAETVFNETAREFAERFGRTYEPVERFHTDDAEVVFVMSNSFATKGKSAVLKLRKQGIKAGLLKLRHVQTFSRRSDCPMLLPVVRQVAVIDQNLAPGMGGIIYPEIVTALYGTKGPPGKNPLRYRRIRWQRISKKRIFFLL